MRLGIAHGPDFPGRSLLSTARRALALSKTGQQVYSVCFLLLREEEYLLSTTSGPFCSAVTSFASLLAVGSLTFSSCHIIVKLYS